MNQQRFDPHKKNQTGVMIHFNPEQVVWLRQKAEDEESTISELVRRFVANEMKTEAS